MVYSNIVMVDCLEVFIFPMDHIIFIIIQFLNDIR